MADLNILSNREWRVGIDLAPVNRGQRAPGTSRHVSSQARALFRESVPWEWVPCVESSENPLWSELESLSPVIVPGKKIWKRATFDLGRVWQKERCDLGFATAYFIPVSGPPSVVNFFDSNLFEFGNTWISSGFRWNYYLNRTLSQHAICRAKKLFINSEYCRNKLVEKFPQHAEKLVVAPCGIEPPSEEPGEKTEWATSLSKPFFLYVGVFSDNKNQFRLLDAWHEWQKQDPGAPALVLVGPYPEDYFRERIRPRLEKLPRPHEVFCPGRISDENLLWLYRHALAYVQPSIAEGFGLPVVEAMSYGLPVACSNTTSLPETAGDAALYFNPVDASSILKTTMELNRDGSLRKVFQEKSADRWRQFTWKKNAGVVIDQIEKTLSTIFSK